MTTGPVYGTPDGRRGLRPLESIFEHAWIYVFELVQNEATEQDRNSVQVGYDVFVNVPALDARDVSALQNVYDADDLDFRLRPGSAAVDRGMVLPTVTDGFTGSAPDSRSAGGRWRRTAVRAPPLAYLTLRAASHACRLTGILDLWLLLQPSLPPARQRRCCRGRSCPRGTRTRRSDPPSSAWRPAPSTGSSTWSDPRP